jgi:type I restriction enzyme M protein
VTVDCATGERLVTRAEIATLAGVTRPTPNVWEGRHRDFPTPLMVEGRELFRLGEVLRWLEGRTVPRNARTPEEAVGITYADRIRWRLAGGVGPRWRAVDAAEHWADAPEDLDAQRRMDGLMALVAERLRDPGSGWGYLNLVLAIVLLRRAAPERWTTLCVERPSLHNQEGVRDLLRRIGDAADAVLHARGLPTRVESSLVFLRPEDGRDLDRILQACDVVSPEGLWSWLEGYRSELSWRGDYLTPPDLAGLMVSLLVDAGDGRRVGEPRWFYDPYARAGELLATAARQVSDPSGLVLHGSTPSGEAFGLAALNLTLHDISPRLDVHGPAPWDHPDWSPPGADYVLSNPPFGTRSNPADRWRRDGDWPFGPPPLGSDAFAWLQLCVEALNPTGRAAVLMPAGAAFSTGRRETDIRREMVERGAVEGIVALPAQVIPGTSVATCLWLLRAPTGTCDRVLFIDARRYGEPTRGRRRLTPQETEAIHHAYTAFRRDRDEGRTHTGPSGFSHAVDVTEIRARNYSLLAQDYHSAPPGPTTGSPAAMIEVQDQLSRARERAASAETPAHAVTQMTAHGRDGESASTPQHVPLRSLCEIQAGPSYSRLTSQVRSAEGEVPVVLPKHLRNGRIAPVDGERVPLHLAQQLERFRLAAGDLLCVRSGAMGQLAVVEQAQAGRLFSTNLLRLRPLTPDVVDPAYLLTYLSLPSTTAWIKHCSMGTVVASLRSDTLGELQIPLPPVSDQRHITAAIATLDARTQSYQQLASASAHARTVVAEQLMNGVQVLP